jgi:hypothetical protein
VIPNWNQNKIPEKVEKLLSSNFFFFDVIYVNMEKKIFEGFNFVSHPYKFQISNLLHFPICFSLLLAHPQTRNENPQNHIGKLDIKKKKSLFL